MRVLYIYRHPDMGFSIGKVFRPIEEEMRKYAEVDSVYMPCANYKPLSLWRNIKAARKAARQKRYDIVHITGTEHYLLPFLKKENTVVTVHDLGFITQLGGVTYRNYFKYLLFVKTLNESGRCTFISSCSRSEAVSLVNFKEGQDTVVYNPVDSNFKFVQKTINVAHPRILQIGTKGNKNLEKSIEALAGISCHLRVIGSLSETQKALLDKYKIEYSVGCNLSDAQIIEEYQKADVVMFPSLYEGFGMPIIEGQATGRPVLTSNIEPMLEVANGSAALADPHDAQSIRTALLHILENPAKYIKKGNENIKRFDLETITKEYLSVYNSILKK